MKRVTMSVAVCTLAALIASCGGSPSSPTPTYAQIAGVWRALTRVTGVTTSECVGSALAANGIIGSTSNATAQIAQNGATVTVTASDNDTGATTHYTGTVGTSTLALTWQSCDLCAIQNFQCLPGVFRTITPQAESISANVNGSTMTGTDAITYNVTVSSSGAPAGVLTINGSFSATKQ